MFDAGFSELVLIFVIGLLILGPERLPRVAAQLGRWVARARRTANQLRMQLEREVALDEIRRTQDRKPGKPAGPGKAAAASSEPGGDPPPDAVSSSPGAARAAASEGSATASSDNAVPGPPGEAVSGPHDPASSRPAPGDSAAAGAGHSERSPSAPPQTSEIPSEKTASAGSSSTR